VGEALWGVHIPDEVPAGCLFVPKEVRSEILQWGHASALAGHSGTERTSVDFASFMFSNSLMNMLPCTHSTFDE